METSPIRILVADDHPLFREGVRRLLEIDPGFLVVGEAADGDQAVRMCVALQPHVVLLDVCMPRLSGIEALSRLREEAPQTAAILLTASIDRRNMLEAVMLGARGVIIKSTDTDVLLKCVRQVALGGYWIEHDTINELVVALRGDRAASVGASPTVHLTRRELQIISAIIGGASNIEIGRSFGLRHQTVKNHLTRIFDKLGVSTRLELALYAINHGLAGALGDEFEGSPN